jgi:hypothetical protein
MVSRTPGATRSASILGIAAVFSLAASAAAPTGAGDSAPRLAVGDRWQYRVTDNLRRGAQSQLDVEVISVTGGAARIRVRRADGGDRTEWIDEVDSEGGLAAGSLNRETVRSFDPPVKLLAFPLDKGKTWRQTINTLRKDTGVKDQILIYGRVNGPATVSVPAGRFDAIAVYRTVQLDDAEFWRSRTSRTDSIWYAPAAKASVREKREALYTQRDGGRPQVRTESTLLELMSFQPGGK